MVSRLEKIICNLYFCYIPIIGIAFFTSIKLIELTPTKCLFDSLSSECTFYRFSFNSIYHPLNIINLLFIIYNILYIYYNVILKQNIVGRTVRKIYFKTNELYQIKNQRKQISILLFCYFAALIISYLRFLITLTKII